MHKSGREGVSVLYGVQAHRILRTRAQRNAWMLVCRWTFAAPIWNMMPASDTAIGLRSGLYWRRLGKSKVSALTNCHPSCSRLQLGSVPFYLAETDSDPASAPPRRCCKLGNRCQSVNRKDTKKERGRERDRGALRCKKAVVGSLCGVRALSRMAKGERNEMGTWARGKTTSRPISKNKNTQTEARAGR